MDPKLPFTKTLADGRVGWEAVIRSSRLNEASAPMDCTAAVSSRLLRRVAVLRLSVSDIETSIWCGWKVRSSPLFLQGIYGSLNARTTPPLPSKEFPEVTNSIFPTGVAAEFTDPGIRRVRSKSPVCAS
jgi:hypothetical protein